MVEAQWQRGDSSDEFIAPEKKNLGAPLSPISTLTAIPLGFTAENWSITTKYVWMVILKETQNHLYRSFAIFLS